jgi:taurine dioxygenase
MIASEEVAMDYVLTPLTEHGIGAEVRGIELKGSVDAQTRQRLNADFARYHVLVIRDQQMDSDGFLCAAEVFGEIMPHHRASGNTVENPRVYEVRNTEVAPGKYFIQGETFHTDHSNDPIPPKATSLFPVSLPSRGGDTQFVDMHRAYDELPPAMKQRVEKLKAVHVYLSKYSPRALKKLDEDSLRKLPPPAIHPLVRVHPENGRKFLYLNPVRMESILGMPDDEAQALIAELMAHATQRKYEYRHQWRYGDMVIWDNRSVMHQANGDYDMREVRRLYRIMLKGVAHPDEFVTEAERRMAPQQRVPA